MEENRTNEDDIFLLTVTLCRTQSSQNLLADSFFLVTMVSPSVRVLPWHTATPALWYMGSTEYKTSLSDTIPIQKRQ